MAPSNSFLSAVPLNQLYVWVLAPHLETSDPNIDYYYDFSQSIAEYSKTFNELDVEWKWQPVTINNYASVIDNIAKKVEEEIDSLSRKLNEFGEDISKRSKSHDWSFGKKKEHHE